MTVRKLIKRLEKLPPNTRVFIQGEGSGYSDYWDSDFKIKEFVLNFNEGEPFQGEHESASWVEDEDLKKHKVVKGISIDV